MPGIAPLGQTPLAAVPSGAETILGSKWYTPLAEPVRQKIVPALAVALIAAGAAVPPIAPFPETVSESRWHQPWSEPVRIRPALPAGEQHVFAFDPVPFVKIDWFGSLAEPVRARPGLRPQLQQPIAWQPAPSPFVAAGWFAWLAEPVRVRPALPAGGQQFFAAPAWPDVRVGWFAALAEPVRIRPAVLVPAQAQQFQPFDEDIIFVDRWFAWWSQPVRIKPALGAASHQVLAFDPQPFPFLGGGGGWPDGRTTEDRRQRTDEPADQLRSVIRRPSSVVRTRQVEPAVAPPTFADTFRAQQPARLADVLGSAFVLQMAALAPPALDLYVPPARPLPLPRVIPPAVTDAAADHVDAIDAMEALQALDMLEQQQREMIIAVLLGSSE